MKFRFDAQPIASIRSKPTFKPNLFISQTADQPATPPKTKRKRDGEGGSQITSVSYPSTPSPFIPSIPPSIPSNKKRKIQEISQNSTISKDQISTSLLEDESDSTLQNWIEQSVFEDIFAQAQQNYSPLMPSFPSLNPHNFPPLCTSPFLPVSRESNEDEICFSLLISKKKEEIEELKQLTSSNLFDLILDEY